MKKTSQNENFKYFAKLSGSAFASFVKINILASVSTVLVFIIEFFLLSKDIDAGSSGHASASPFLVTMFLSRPIGSILWYISAIVSPILFFSLGNKYIISKIANKLITDKSEKLLNPLLDRILAKFQEKQTETVRNSGDFALAQLRIIHGLKNAKNENKWLRRVLVFGLKKIKLDDVDFSDQNQNFAEIIKVKTHLGLQDISAPDRKIILIPIACQWIILLFIWFTNF
ncbi:hypothetical protein [Frigoriflavimonas asaccharolytica]|uniref:Uncharacterized protein n=1 Tax=Frigoriflavimonas asaccharolytica TaxID=2735899 RepID=A0A8J8K3V9_9FLAO|nr:hypothetical protein [Frigoriflavimonas asaccharolytica]NRS91065.1 hypothetical protein [Frigoriflavimonas asaccharolytica]